MDVLLSIEKAAIAFGEISPWTVRTWIAKGTLGSVKLGGRRMIKQSEIERLIAEGTVPATELSTTKQGA